MVNNNTQALTLKTLLSDNKYIIPIYQRNYAWGKAEISQLIRDIKEFFTTDTDKNYYIGSLVCFKRENGDFELIDGQQRHTTISLINAVLRHWEFKEDQQKKVENTVCETNLKFDSRKNIQRFLEDLYATSEFEKFIGTSTIPGTQNFIDAINFIVEEFNEKDFNVACFTHTFYNKVKFFRVEVPLDTDLNHYFEIMNNRGEQLEKHEIVKALLMGKIKNNDKAVEKVEQETFAIIWDACSDMNDYVYFNFDIDSRKKLFYNRALRANDFSDLKKDIKINNDDEDLKLFEILKTNNLPENFPKEEKQIKEKYKSVIDFPNFLLQVLKLESGDISLDDKNLLKAFEKEINPKKFIFDLLKYRTIFDKYIIKQDLSDSDEEKQNWSIRTINSDYDGVEKTYKEHDDEELIKLQTMLYYSNPSNTNNNWVQTILNKKYFEDDPVEHAKKVFNEIAKPRFDNENLSYPAVTAYNLYFIDLLLWKRYRKEVQGNDKHYTENTLDSKIAKNKELFNTFKFRSLNSKEHLYPQASIHPIDNSTLNGIGNLCLISTSQNSAGNKENPIDKKERFKSDNSSLKRLIMFESFENDKWGAGQIQAHENEMKTLLKDYFPEKILNNFSNQP